MTWRVSDEDLTALGERIVSAAEGAVTGFAVAFGDLTVMAPAHRVVDVLTVLRDHPDLQFRQLMDVCGADYPQRALRFDVVYHLLALPARTASVAEVGTPRRVRVLLPGPQPSRVGD